MMMMTEEEGESRGTKRQIPNMAHHAEAEGGVVKKKRAQDPVATNNNRHDGCSREQIFAGSPTAVDKSRDNGDALPLRGGKPIAHDTSTVQPRATAKSLLMLSSVKDSASTSLVGATIQPQYTNLISLPSANGNTAEETAEHNDHFPPKTSGEPFKFTTQSVKSTTGTTTNATKPSHPPSSSLGHRKNHYFAKFLLLVVAIMGCLVAVIQGFIPIPIITTTDRRAGDSKLLDDDQSREYLAKNKHIIRPTPTLSTGRPLTVSPNVTLRSFLEDEAGFSLAMAPAFFGFYGYFGVLAAWDEHLTTSTTTSGSLTEGFLQSGRLRSLAGASAGAMAAVLLSAGIKPRAAGEFCSTVTLDKFNDFPGFGGIFKGDLFEQLMENFLMENINNGSNQNRSLLLLQNALHPVAVTAFCLQSMQGKVLKRGSMARAARASATFPLLFQPVGWLDRKMDDNDADPDYFTLIDGGVNDTAGIAGLESLDPKVKGHRVVNLKVGPFLTRNKPPGPKDILDAQEVLCISIQNLPQCGPWAMERGSVALEAAHDAIVASLDLPLFVDEESGRHYELHIDASTFWEL
ncbi:hypothetical protein ACA910_004938 [Epithemia clementina (nom. ined.)]